jgi:hypothetical protein
LRNPTSWRLPPNKPKPLRHLHLLTPTRRLTPPLPARNPPRLAIFAAAFASTNTQKHLLTGLIQISLQRLNFARQVIRLRQNRRVRINLRLQIFNFSGVALQVQIAAQVKVLMNRVALIATIATTHATIVVIHALNATTHATIAALIAINVAHHAIGVALSATVVAWGAIRIAADEGIGLKAVQNAILVPLNYIKHEFLHQVCVSAESLSLNSLNRSFRKLHRSSMSPEIITASIAAVVAVISASISVYGQVRAAQFADRLAKQREAESRETKTATLMSKYRDPLLRSTIDLQSRLFNIYQNQFLTFSNRSPAERIYAIDNTLYVLAEYFGWVEILRREVQFLDLGDLEMNRRLSELLVNVTKAFGNSSQEPTFRLFNGEQRAIGEIVLVPRSMNEERGYECMGYASFVKKMAEPEFARSFAKPKADMELMLEEPQVKRARLIQIHSRLIDLLDFLDPHGIRVPPEYRTRISAR